MLKKAGASVEDRRGRLSHSGTGLPACQRTGQASVEFALLYAGVILPLTFGIILVSQILWMWHSVSDFTRDGVRYAATHCWQSDSSNVRAYMQSHVPPMIDMDQFQTGAAEITVRYFARDTESGELTDFSCDSAECSAACVPDAVTVTITNYQFRQFANFLGLPSVTMPDLGASMAIGSAGCDEAGTCLP